MIYQLITQSKLLILLMMKELIYLSYKKIGRTKALNFGLKKINSDLIAIQDADDISEPDRIEKTINCFNDSRVGLVCSRSKFIDQNGDEIFNKFNKIKEFSSKKLKS